MSDDTRMNWRSSGFRWLCLMFLALPLAACGAADDGGQAASAAPERPGSSGVAFVYHHVSEDTPRSTSVTPASFEAHLRHLEENDYQVWSLADLVSAVDAGDDIPPRTVALTFDDAYESVYDTALPMLEARGWPLTIFVSTQYIDDGLRNYMTWDQLRSAEARGAAIANHSIDHPSMAAPTPGESEREWLARVRDDIERAQARLEAEVRAPVRHFAWPYGEYSPPVEALLEDLGFFGFAQRSGAIGPHSPRTALPRYPMATGFDALDDFALKAASRPLPVIATRPESGVVAPDEDAPSATLTLAEGRYRADALQCYSRGETLPVERIGNDPLRIRIGPAEAPLRVGRTIFNCTAPASDANAWYWHSVLWMRPREDGSWYEG